MVQKTTCQELEQKIETLEEELQKRIRSEKLTNALLHISKAVSVIQSSYEFFKTVHMALSAVIDTTNFFIALYDPGKDSVTFPYFSDTVDTTYPPVIDISKTASLTAEVIRTQSPLLITKTEVLKRWSKSNLMMPPCTPSEIWLGVPLQVKGKILGVMSVQNYHDPECYDYIDLDLMVSVAEFVAIAIENLKVEESLRVSESRFRSIFDFAVEGILLGSSEGYITEANKYMSELTGLPRNELLGKHISELAFTKESMAQYPLRFDLLKRGKKVTNERVLIRPDGSKITVEMQSKMMPDGTYQSIYSDITARKGREKALLEAEERFRLAFLTSPDAININTMDGTYVDVNIGFTELTGYTREECAGKSSSDINIWDIPEDRQRLIEGLQRDGQVKNLESRFLLKNGSKKIGLMSANIVQLSGEPHILSVTKDISLLKKTEQEKRDLEIKYMQSQKMEAIGIMAGGIAHDFNNMLAIILGNAEMALVHISDENPGKHCLQQILSASQRVKDLVKQILTFSRQNDQEFLPLHLFSVIRDSLQLLRATIPTTVSIVQNFSQGDDTAMADATQIHQLIMNLCSNAVHAMDEKGTLEVTGAVIDITESDVASQPGVQPGRYVRLRVSDTGVGIAKEIQEQIFDPFFTTKGVHEGTGMGLSIVLGIVKSHKGVVEVSSEPGDRTTFTIFFPALEKGQLAEIDKISEEHQRGSERILFIDDEEMLAEMGGRLLEELGYHVTVKLSSLDALATFASTPDAFDVVITDQSMPHMSGAELSVQLLKIRPDIPIILCTGYSKKITEKETQRLGIKKYLTKPYDTAGLVKLIRKVLQ